MKILLLFAAMMAQSTMALSKTVSVPLSNITCERGPYRTVDITVTLPSPIGTLTGSGVLAAAFVQARCPELLADLEARAHDGVLDLTVQYDAVTTIRIYEGESRRCESSREETLSAPLTPRINLLGGGTAGFGPSPCPVL